MGLFLTLAYFKGPDGLWSVQWDHNDPISTTTPPNNTHYWSFIISLNMFHAPIKLHVHSISVMLFDCKKNGLRSHSCAACVHILWFLHRIFQKGFRSLFKCKSHKTNSVSCCYENININSLLLQNKSPLKIC